MSKPIVLDVETQHTFQEVGYDHQKLKVSVVCIYDYATNTYEAYFEKDLQKLFNKLEKASFTIGFNIDKFDFPVMSPYYVGKMDQFPTLDLLEEIRKSIGFRVALDDVARATLNAKKSGHGFLAIDYFKNGEFEKLKDYCLEDVRITKEIYEFGKKNKMVYFLDSKGKREIRVSFEKKNNSNSAVSLSLPI